MAPAGDAASGTDGGGGDGNKPAMDHFVSQTALLVCAHRVHESRRPDALFKDPLAEIMVPETYLAEIAAEGVSGNWFIPTARAKAVPAAATVVRHHFFDERARQHLWAAHERGEAPQLVNIAAGLDGRAFRDLPYPPNTTIFEVDRGEVLDFKARQLAAHPELQPVCRRVAIAADVVTDAWEEQLVAQGFRRDQPSVWLAEGLLCYLPHDVAAALLRRMAAMAAPGSFLGADAFNSALIRMSAAQGAHGKLAAGGAAIVFGPDDPEAFLKGSGWDAPCVWQYGGWGAHFGRWPFPLAPPRWVDRLVLIPRFWLLTATVTAEGKEQQLQPLQQHQQEEEKDERKEAKASVK